MPEHDALAATIAELRSLSGRDRRAILAVLEPEERARAAALLGEGPEPAPAPAPAEAAPALSPWLAERLAADDGRVTPATRRALAEAVKGADGGVAGGRAANAAAQGRSLLGAVGAFFGRGSAAL